MSRLDLVVFVIDGQRYARAPADQGDLERARELCETTLARDRLNAEAHLLLASIHQVPDRRHAHG